MRTLGKIVLILVAAAALGGGGIYFWQRFFQADRMTQEAIASLARAQWAHLELSYKRFSETQATPFGFVEWKGDVDFSDAAFLRMQGSAELAVSPRSGSEHIVMDMRSREGVVQVRYDRAPKTLLSFLSSAGVESQSWQWLPGYKELFALFLGSQDVGSLAGAQKLERLRERLLTTHWFAKTRATWTEIVHGRAARVVEADLDASAVAEFEETLFALRYDRAPNASEAQAMQDGAASWRDAQLTLWIENSAHALERLRLVFPDGTEWIVDVDRINMPVAWQDDADLPDASLSNEPLPVADTLVDVSKTASPASAIVITGTDRDGDGLSDEQEIFYGANAAVADTDGDGFTDGDEVRNGYNPRGAGRLFDFGLPRL